CFINSSSTRTQHFSVARRFARPPAANRISKLPQPISLATAQTASSSPISPSSSSVTQMVSMPSDSRTLMSSSLITCPLASNFFPPGRNTVQQSIRPLEDLTSTVCALIVPHSRYYGFLYPVSQYSSMHVGFHLSFVCFDLGKRNSLYYVAFSGYELPLAQDRQLHKAHSLLAEVVWGKPPMFGPEDPHYRDFIAALKFGATEAILPGLERQLTALDLLEPHLAEKLGDISEGEYRIERVSRRLLDERFDQPS